MEDICIPCLTNQCGLNGKAGALHGVTGVHRGERGESDKSLIHLIIHKACRKPMQPGSFLCAHSECVKSAPLQDPWEDYYNDMLAI